MQDSLTSGSETVEDIGPKIIIVPTPQGDKAAPSLDTPYQSRTVKSTLVSDRPTSLTATTMNKEGGSRQTSVPKKRISEAKDETESSKSGTEITH